MQQHGSKYFARRTPLPPGPKGMGSKDQNSTFSERGYVSDQIKGNHECSNMVASIFLADKVNLGVGEMGIYVLLFYKFL